MFVDGSECPSCKVSDFSTNWRGRVAVLDSGKSEIAQRVGFNTKGEYAIKVR